MQTRYDQINKKNMFAMTLKIIVKIVCDAENN